MSVKRELQFFAYQWSVDEKNDDSTLIRIYGMTSEGKNVYVRVDNFTPYCYIELPTHIEWTNSKINLVSEKLSKMNRKLYQPVKQNFVKRRKLYYAWKQQYQDENGKTQYKDEVFPFLFFAFRSLTALRNFSVVLRRDIEIEGIGKLKFNVHENEAGVSPVLKLLALKKLPSAGWIGVKGTVIPEEDRESTFDIEMSCSYETLKPIDTNTTIHPRVLCFDIEANSTITSAMPDASRPNDKVFQLGFVTSISGEKKKYLFSLGEPDGDVVGKDVELRNFKNEADLLVAMSEFIHEKEFNVIIGYNILGWDFQYMINRAKFTRCISEFDKMGCLQGVHDTEVAPQFESKAYSAQKLVYLDSEGRLYLDLLPIIKREHKLVNYRLKTVTTHFGLPTKDPLTAQDIFRCYREFTPKSLGEVGKYCVQDAYITMLLYEKLQIWFGLCEMAKTAHVPIFYLFTKGTQIQMFSQVMEYCMYNNYVIISNGYKPSEGEEEYMGATVLNPVPGKYKKVLSFDFASLYPSIMMAYNIDYSTLVPEPEHYLIGKYDNNDYLMCWDIFPCYIKLINEEKGIRIWKSASTRDHLKEIIDGIRNQHPSDIIILLKDKSEINDEDCHVFLWEDHHNCEHDELRPKLKNGEFSKAKKKIICGKRYYRFIKAIVGGKGIIPTLLENLISQRKQTRKQIVENEREIKTSILRLMKNCEYDKNAKKFIDEMKDREKKLFENIETDLEVQPEEEMTLTRINDIVSRANELYIINQVYDKRQLSYKVCANSVSATTPIPCRDKDGNIIYRTIEELSDGNWISDNENNQVSSSIPGLMVWTEKGFTTIKCVIRHPVRTPLKRVSTFYGIVDVTDEHSLLDEKGNEIRTIDVDIGDKLLHRRLDLPSDTPTKPMFPFISEETIQSFDLKNDIRYETAFLQGLYFSAGSCERGYWNILNNDYKLLTRVLKIAEKIEDSKFTITSLYENSYMYYLQLKKLDDTIYKKYRELFYDSRNNKRVPDCILNSDYYTRQSFFMGCYAGNGNRYLEREISLDVRGEIGATSLLYIMNSIGYKVRINCIENVFLLTCRDNFKSSNIIQSIRNSPHVQKDEFIYDIETENHHFAAGVGDIIVHNSMYGAMGVKKGYLPLVPGASTVTYRGRKAIEFISTYIPEKYNGITVYGDTDSSMIYFPHLKDNKDAVELAEHITVEMEQYFPKPMKLEFEKIYEKYLILTKKRYMAHVANKKGEIIDFTKKGVVLSRRDNCKFLRDIYLETSVSLLDDVHENEIMTNVIDGINNLFQRKYSFKDFVITKTLSKEYKAKTLPAHVQLADRMKKRGIEVTPGSRIEYLFTTRCQGEKNPNQGDKVEDIDYFRQWKNYLRVDYLYYMDKQLVKPLDELLRVGLGVEDFVKQQFELRLQKCKILEEIKDLFSTNIMIEGEVATTLKKKKTTKPTKTTKLKKSLSRIFVSTESDNEDDSDEKKEIDEKVTRRDDVDEKEIWNLYSSKKEIKVKDDSNYYGVQI